MREYPITHICPAVTGGVDDYVDVIRSNSSASHKLPIAIAAGQIIALPDVCFLHYSGYGYAKRGAPSWLLNNIRLQRPKIRALGILFHELYAIGPPWTSAFWLSPQQRKIASELAKLSDFWITNRQGSADWLLRHTPSKPYAVLPVFSNVGEKTVYSETCGGKLVVFGSAELRKRTYKAAGERLFAWASKQGLTVLDIGTPIEDPAVAALLRRERVTLYGRMAPYDVSALLADASFGLVEYPTDYVAKSGVFAAYCSHGVCPILISECDKRSDGLVANEHYLAEIPTQKISKNIRTGIARSAWEWYQPHRVQSHLEMINRLSQSNYIKS